MTARHVAPFVMRSIVPVETKTLLNSILVGVWCGDVILGEADGCEEVERKTPATFQSHFVPCSE